MDIELSTALLFILVPAAIGAITMLINDRRGAYAMSVFGSVLIWLSVLGASRATTRPLETVAPWLENLGLNIYMVLDTNIVWLDRVDANFLFEVDAFALGLIAMTTLVTFAASTFGFIAGRERPGVYHGLLWLTAAAVMGLFVARDLLAFYMFFELMLIPVFFLLGIWGGADRIRATLTLVIYTVVGSLIMLVALIGMGLQAGTFDIAAIAIQVGEARAAGADGLFADWMFWSVMIAIAIKAPLVPFHAWQPLAYRQAGAEVTALLSGVISKAAMVTGLVILLPLFPAQLDTYGTVLIIAAVVTLLYGSVTAFRQPDIRGVLTYSSLAQMGLILLGLFVAIGDGRDQAISGAYLQSINHGLVSAAMFLLAGFIELRTGTGDMARLGGAATGRPVLATTAIFLAMVALALPGTNVFAGEFLILLGAFDLEWYWGVLGSLAVVFAAMYVLRIVGAVLHTEHDDGPKPPDVGTDLTLHEGVALAPLVVAIAALTLSPALAADNVDRTSPRADTREPVPFSDELAFGATLAFTTDDADAPAPAIDPTGDALGEPDPATVPADESEGDE